MNADELKMDSHRCAQNVSIIPAHAGTQPNDGTRVGSPQRGFVGNASSFSIGVHLRLSAVALAFALFSLAHGQRQAQLPWWDRAPARQIGPYWIKSDLSASQVDAIGRHLNMMHVEFSQRLAHVPVRVQEKLDVYAFANRDEWEMTVRTRFAMKPPQSGGFLVSPSDYCLAFFIEGLSPREIDQIIQREGFRQFAHTRFERDLPLWLSEGLADLYGEAVIVDNALVFGQSTPRMLEDVKAAAMLNKHVPFDLMLNISAEDWAAQQAAHQGEYIWHQARLMSLFVMQAPQAFAIYLTHLNNGLPNEHAFARAFGIDPIAVDAKWKQFAMAAQPGAFATALERIEFLSAGLRELHKQNITPDSIASLKKYLRDIDFTLELPTLHGTHRMTAADDTVFQIPKDVLCAQQPVFIVTKNKPAGGTQRQREVEQSKPAPLAIATQHLRPANLRIQWLRDEQGEFTHQISAR